MKGNGLCIDVDCPEEEYKGRWSWVKSIDGYSHRKNVFQAMRLASRKGTFGDVDKVSCASCGVGSLLSVDHKSTSFNEIAKRFFTKFGDPGIAHTSDGWQLLDELSFVSFHDEIADYQVLCVSCNSKKGCGSG